MIEDQLGAELYSNIDTIKIEGPMVQASCFAILTDQTTLMKPYMFRLGIDSPPQ